MSSSNPIEYYYSNDSIENLKLRITITETSRLHEIENEPSKATQPLLSQVQTSLHSIQQQQQHQNRPLYSKSFILNWQDKLFSPGEYGNCIKSLVKNTTSDIPRENEIHRDIIEKSKQEKKNIDSYIDDVMLYTYNDKDDYLTFANPPLVDAYDEPIQQVNYLAKEKLTTDETDNNLKRLYTRQKGNHDNYHEMIICCGTDIDTIKLRAGAILDPSYHYTENILCHIRVYDSGKLEISPGFSDILEENDQKVDTITSLAANVSDVTLEKGLRNGFKLSRYSFKSKSGSTYEYSIENISNIILPAIIQDVRESEIIHDYQRIHQNTGIDKKYLLDDNWKQDPPGNDCNHTLSFYGEIISGSELPNDHCYVSYRVILPSDWKVRTGNLSDGLAEDKIKKQGNIYHDGYLDDEEGNGMLQGTTATVSSCENYYHPKTYNCKSRYKSIINSSLSRPSRILISITYMIITFISVLVGINYPFWIVPHLVIFFYLITGTPGSQHIVRYKKPSSSSPSKASPESSSSELIHEVYHFNHMISLSFDFDKKSLEYYNQAPIIVFEVYSIGLFDRHRLEGYGYHKLTNLKTPMKDIEISLWKPINGILSEMNDHYLGCSPRYKDIRDVFHYNDSLASIFELNRHGVQTQSGGKLRFRYQTMVTNPQHALKNNMDKYRVNLTNNYKSMIMKQIQTRQTIENILDNYKSSVGMLSRQSSSSTLSNFFSKQSNMSQSHTTVATSASAANTLVSSSLNNLPTKTSSILDALTSHDRAERVAQILASAKAKSKKLNQTISSISPIPIAGDHSHIQLNETTNLSVSRNLFERENSEEELTVISSESQPLLKPQPALTSTMANFDTLETTASKPPRPTITSSTSSSAMSSANRQRKSRYIAQDE